MVEVPKNKSKSAILETVVVAGLFMSAFYFLFFEEIDEVLKKYGVKDGGELKESDTNTTPEPKQPLNPEQYAGRTDFCSKSNSENCIKGFPMPNSIDDLIFSDNGLISIMTKPDSSSFGLPSKAMVRVYRIGDDLVYNGRINGVKSTYSENYYDIKNDIALPSNKYLK
jgi:hypothetical protein